MRLFELPARKNGAADLQLPENLKQVVKTERKTILDEMAARQSAWFDEEMDKLDNWAEDKRAGLKADLKELDDEIKAAQEGNSPDRQSAGQAVASAQSARTRNKAR